ncbi:hypothetical protein PENSPDRAFT_506024 [Peniophora sp. CONT]|nr:hypothetical protein PENSPDRAFT_506024 [Peniophora sp. CONT]
MAAATRTRSSKKRGESAHRQRPSCYVLLTKRTTNKAAPVDTTRSTRSQSQAEDEVEDVELAKPVRAKATRKGKGKAKAAPKKAATPSRASTEVEDDGARTPTQANSSQADMPGPSRLLAQASSTRKPPPPPKHVHLGKPAVSFEEARAESRMTTPAEGHETANAASEGPFVPLLLHDTDNPVLEEMTEPEMRLGPPGVRDGNWRIKPSARRTSPPPALPRDYPFADPSSARKSPPPRIHPQRIGKPPQPESSEGGDGDTEPDVSESEFVMVNMTLGDAQYERALELSTPIKPHAQRRTSPPPPSQPPSASGTPKIPPNFRRDGTASPNQPPPRTVQMSHRKLIAEASLRRRQQQQQQQPVSPLPPSSEPTESPSAASERVVQDTSMHNMSHDAFWPGDDELYAGSDPGDHYPDEEEDEDKENVAVQYEEERISHRHSDTRQVVDVLGVGRTLAADESFETPQKPRRYNIRPPATQNTKDEETAALFAPDMSDESGVSNILDYQSVAAKRKAEEEERRRRGRR